MKRLLTSAAMFLCSLLTFAQFTGTLSDSQGVIYQANDDGTTCYVSGHEESYSSTIVIPETYQGRSVTSIGKKDDGWRDGAFQNCSSLTSVTIPNSVTTIGNYTFDQCI